MRALVALLFVALATSGFAHRFAGPEEQAALNYTLAFGLDSSDICGDASGGGGQTGCEACRLHAAMDLPGPAVSLILAELGLCPAAWTPQPTALYTLTAETAPPARAPPFA